MADKIGYMFGDCGNDFTFMLSSMFLMKFYTDIMGVSAVFVGMIMMIARFVDAFTDVTMGQIADRSKTTEKGKFAPWIRRMMGPVAVASLLMYASWFRDMPMLFKLVWMAVTYLLWGSVFYTGVNIPYGSMASVISSDPKERAQLSTWRTIGATIACTAIGVVLPMAVFYTDESGHTALSGTKVSIAAVICSVCAVICYALCYHLTTERVKIDQKFEKFDLGKLLRELVHNRALIGIVVGALFMLIVQNGMMAAYIFPNYFGSSSGQSMSTLMSSVITMVLAMFSISLAERFGKKELTGAAAILGAVGMIAAYFVHTDNMKLYLVFYVLCYIGLAAFNLNCWAMITDVIDDAQIRTGRRADGTIYSVYSFARKLGQAAGSGITGALLSAVGYSQATAFDTNIVDGIYNISCLVPAMGMIMFAFSMFVLYPLDKKTVLANAEKLKKEN